MPYRLYADAMFGSLGKFLRILGFDTLIAPDHLLDKEIMVDLISSKRLLITRDLEFSKIYSKYLELNHLDHKLILYIPSTILEDQIYYFFRHLGIKSSHFIWNDINQISFLPRCSKCNDLLNEIDKETIKNDISEGTYSRFKKFWRCNSLKCNKIYWIGRHWDSILEVLMSVKKKENLL